MNNTDCDFTKLLEFLDDILKNLYYNNTISDYDIKTLCFIIYQQKHLNDYISPDIDAIILNILRHIREDTMIFYENNNGNKKEYVELTWKDMINTALLDRQKILMME